MSRDFGTDDFVRRFPELPRGAPAPLIEPTTNVELDMPVWPIVLLLGGLVVVLVLAGLFVV